MSSRRQFFQRAAGAAGALMIPARVPGANDRIRIGIIGPGARGMNLVQQAIECPNTEFAAFADVFTKRLEAGKKVAPAAKTYLDYRYLLEDRSIDAVIIATPQHLHCEHFCAALDAGKQVYQEKTMAFTVEHAKLMRAAYKKAGKRTVQIGHQDCSTGHVADAAAFLASGHMGKITNILATEYRNTPPNRPQWSRQVTRDMTAENIVWKSFLGDAPPHEFEAQRYINWRFYWDCAGANFYENMCYQLAFWYKVMNLKVPTTISAVGGLYLWQDGREVPDTVNVAMDHGDLLFAWNSGFGNNLPGDSEQVLGTHGSILRSSRIRYVPQKVNRPDGVEVAGKEPEGDRNGHMQNFLDCIRSGKEPNCPVELGYRVAIACRMAVESYRSGRTLHWDPVKEVVV